VPVAFGPPASTAPTAVCTLSGIVRWRHATWRAMRRARTAEAGTNPMSTNDPDNTVRIAVMQGDGIGPVWIGVEH